MTCQHQFHLIKQTVRTAKDAKETNSTSSHVIAGRWDDEYGAKVGCSLCGEIRTVWENGDVEINTTNEKTSDTKN